MARLFLLTALLVSLAFQGVAVAAQRLVMDPGGSDHAALHLQDVAHHHGDHADPDDVSVVVDDSAESAAHLAIDGASSALALPVAVASIEPVMAAGTSPPWRAACPAGPDLVGLRRPPRTLL